MGNEAYYEEQELGLHPPAPATSGETGYGESSYGYPRVEPQEETRGRSRTRSPYEENLRPVDRNPFGDDNAASLRGVSPRPLETEGYGGSQAREHKKKGSTGSEEESPTERRSIFRENM